MTTIYRQLLRLYPIAHRRKFEQEMLDVLDQLQADASARTSVRAIRLHIREIFSLLRGALRERWRESSMRRFDMSTEFRFPKITWILMTVILAGVVLAIRKGEAISVSLPHDNPALAPIHPASAVLSGWTLSFVVMYAAGLLIGGVMFVVRRSRFNQLER